MHAAFELLRQGTEDIRAPQRPRRRLRIGLLSSFATRWLAPRLPAFSAAHPDIELQLQPDIGLADVAGGEVDAAIRYGRGPGRRARAPADARAPVSGLRAVADCRPETPALAARSAAPSAADLALPQSFEWPAWARLTGVDLGGVQNVPLHDYNIVIEAALAGQGVAMGRHRMIAAQLASGALVEPCPAWRWTIRASAGGWSRPGAADPDVQTLHDWLVEAARRPARRSDPRSLAPLAFDQCCLEPRSMRQACRQAPATHYFYSCVPGEN